MRIIKFHLQGILKYRDVSVALDLVSFFLINFK